MDVCSLVRFRTRAAAHVHSTCRGQCMWWEEQEDWTAIDWISFFFVSSLLANSVYDLTTWPFWPSVFLSLNWVLWGIGMKIQSLALNFSIPSLSPPLKISYSCEFDTVQTHDAKYRDICNWKKEWEKRELNLAQKSQDRESLRKKILLEIIEEIRCINVQTLDIWPFTDPWEGHKEWIF